MLLREVVVGDGGARFLVDQPVVNCADRSGDHLCFSALDLKRSQLGATVLRQAVGRLPLVHELEGRFMVVEQCDVLNLRTDHELTSAENR